MIADFFDLSRMRRGRIHDRPILGIALVAALTGCGKVEPLICPATSLTVASDETVDYRYVRLQSQTSDFVVVRCGKCGLMLPRWIGGYAGGIEVLPKREGASFLEIFHEEEGWVTLGNTIGAENDVFLTRDRFGERPPSSEILRVSASGGPSSVLTTIHEPRMHVVLGTADDTNVFFRDTLSGTIYRVARTGGSPVAIGQIAVRSGDGSGSPETDAAMHIVDSELVVSVSKGEVVRIPRNATSTSGQVRITASNPCPTRIVPLKDGYYCSEERELSHYRADFSSKTTIYAGGGSPSRAGQPVDGGERQRWIGIHANHVFFVAATESQEFTLRTFDVGETMTRLVSCGLGPVSSGFVDASAVYLQEVSADRTLSRILKIPY